MTIVHTYKHVDGEMVNDGYFIVTPEYGLRWISLGDMESLINPNKVRSY